MFDLPNEFPLELGLLILTHLSCREVFKLRQVAADLPPNLRILLESESAQKTTLLRWNGKVSQDKDENAKAERIATQHALGRPASCHVEYLCTRIMESQSYGEEIEKMMLCGKHLFYAVKLRNPRDNKKESTATLYDMAGNRYLQVAPRQIGDINSLLLTEILAVVVYDESMLMASLKTWTPIEKEKLTDESDWGNKWFTGISRQRPLQTWSAMAADHTIVAVLYLDCCSFYDFEEDKEWEASIQLDGDLGSIAMVVNASEKIMTVFRQSHKDGTSFFIKIDRFGFDGKGHDSFFVDYTFQVRWTPSVLSTEVVSTGYGVTMLNPETGSRQHKLLIREDGTIEGATDVEGTVKYWKGENYIMLQRNLLSLKYFATGWRQCELWYHSDFLMGEEFMVSWREDEFTIWSFDPGMECPDEIEWVEDSAGRRIVSHGLLCLDEYAKWYAKDGERIFEPVEFSRVELVKDAL